MTVFEFRDPFVHRVQRRCVRCGDYVEVVLIGGATAPREATYRCSDCRTSEIATAAVIEQSRPQLSIVEGGDGG